MARTIHVLGIDIAKLVFHVVGMDDSGHVVLRKRIARSELLTFIANLPPLRIGMESCGSAQIPPDLVVKFQAIDIAEIILPRIGRPTAVHTLCRNRISSFEQPSTAMVVRDACPECGSYRYKNNGHTRYGKQHHQCQACERQFVATAEDRIIVDEQRTLIEHLLRERISLRGICRAVGVRLTWLLRFIVERFAACPDDLHVRLPHHPTDVMLRRLEAEADEMWSFVKRKANKPWVWIAMDATTRQIIAFHVGDRSRGSAQELWAKIPVVDREQATFHTDQYDAYHGVIPAERHKAITKKARKTNHLERFHNTLRQRVSRLVRETLSFSKKLQNHIGAIKFFICSYNLAKAAALPV